MTACNDAVRCCYVAVNLLENRWQGPKLGHFTPPHGIMKSMQQQLRPRYVRQAYHGVNAIIKVNAGRQVKDSEKLKS